MKACTKCCWLLWLVLEGYFAFTGRVAAQTFTTLHNFTDGDDGGFPRSGLIANLSGNSLYGTAESGGSFPSAGTLFKLSTDGTGFNTFHSFTLTNGDGCRPLAGLILSGNTFYGTTAFSGTNYTGGGTVFKVQTDGTGFTTLHSFAVSLLNTNSDGKDPVAQLVMGGNTLYGTTFFGGSSGNGTVFAINTDGTAFTNLYSFTATTSNSSGFWAFYTNSDGAYPTGLILSGDTLYGAAGGGGSNGSGTVFAINTDGTGFTTLYNFSARSGSYFSINNDGAGPNGRLVLLGNTLYGTAANGGSFGSGTVFKLQTDGTGFTTLYNFTSRIGFGFYGNSDGAQPYAGLILCGKTLYGITDAGGSSDNGTVFAINTDGTGFTNLYSFTATTTNSLGAYTNSDGANPRGGLILLGNTLYGTTRTGGTSGYGTVFSLSFPAQLSNIRFGSNLVLSWPTNYVGIDYSGYTLQSATDLTSGHWTTNLPSPVIVNGQYAVTNPISGTQQYFRLSQ